jgi:tRNA pseudouridine65 synthase
MLSPILGITNSTRAIDNILEKWDKGKTIWGKLRINNSFEVMQHFKIPIHPESTTLPERPLLTILYDDPHLVVIDKPPGVLIHRTRISEDKVFLVQLLRDQIGQRVFPIHRLDRGTSGVLIFGKSAESAGLLGVQLMEKAIDKTYLAIVRGWPPEEGTIDYDLDDPETNKGPLKAITHFRRLGTAVIEAPIGLRYSTARFSLIEARLETGRRHQIRKHFSHLRYPVIGDKRHGDVKQNRYFRDFFGLERMFLHSYRTILQHPFSGELLDLHVPVDGVFEQGLTVTGLRDVYEHFSR